MPSGPQTPKEINLRAVLGAVDGPIPRGANSEASDRLGKILAGIGAKIAEQAELELEAVTLEDLA